MARRRKSQANSHRIELLEVRQVMSVDPLADLWGPLVQHGSPGDIPDVIQPGVREDLPQASHHGMQSPPLLPPDATNPHWREADFWLGDAARPSLDEQFDQLEQLLNSAHNVSGLSSVRTNFGLTGAGQTVVIIDSGIAYDHHALGGGYGANYRVVGGWDFTEGDANPYDDGPGGAHGTHVAGIVGSTGHTTGDVGVAPGVDLVGLRVFNDEGNGSFGWVEEALQWVHQNRNTFESPITTVNISLGTTWNADRAPGWSAFLEDDLAQLEADGIFISVSAGNDFGDYNTPGLSYPAASQYVVPVMSMADTGALSGFSQRLDRAIAAPGQTIRSTVPDYAGNHNGTTDDWANFSGTSMAAPYVAGASVLMREAMQLVGWSDITQDVIYGVMRDTADNIFDSVTGLNYKRLNLASAFDAIMPEDDFGSTVDAAHGLGTLSSSTELSGMISTLSDIDYFTFTAGTSGHVTFSADTTHSMVASWQLSSDGGTQSWQGGSDCTFEVVAGQSYTVGLRTTGGLGHYEVGVEVENNFIYTELGTLHGQNNYSNVHTPGDRWLRVVAGQTGYVTAEALFAPASGNVAISIYNSQLNLLAGSNANSSGSRADFHATQGQELFVRLTGVNNDLDVRLTNQVTLSGSTVTVNGTAGNDNLSFVGGTNRTVTVAGVDYSFAWGSVTSYVLNGGGGTDTLSVTGTAGSDTVTVATSQASLTASGLSLVANSFENVTVVGGGGSDTVRVSDTAGDDQVLSWSHRTTLTGAGYSVDVSGFSQVTVFASTGNDSAVLYGTAGDDIYTTWWNRGLMYGTGYWNDVRGFDRTEAHAGAGNDLAVLRDTDGNDTYTTWWNRAIMYGNGYWNDARGFDVMYGMASNGNDVAVLRDSAGDDVFTGRPTQSVMQGGGVTTDARGFDSVRALASTGRDIARLYDSAGDEVYTAWPDRVTLVGSTFSYEAAGFDETQAYASGGYDQAYFYDSAGDDVYTTWSNRAIMIGSSYWNDTRGFDRTQAVATTGRDRVVFRDAPGYDAVHATGLDAYIEGVGYRHDGFGFDQYDLHNTDGESTDEVFRTAVDAWFNFYGNWTLV
jgi:hypothetical protein